MADSLRQFGLRAISGVDRSLMARAARVAASTIEPFYSVTMRLRNFCYDRGWFAVRHLDRPAVSVGNITTGGTGKTPVVQWLADLLRSRGRRPAILLRGYGSADLGDSDERLLLDLTLNGDRAVKIPVHACPSRVEGAGRVLLEHSSVDVFVMDDAFQHRRAARVFDLVLISATNPFGFGHVLPRGLLREPIAGLARVDAFLITRCGLASLEALAEIDRFLRDRHEGVPVYHCNHAHSGLWLPLTGEQVPMSAIADEKVFLTAGIGDPAAFARQIASVGCAIVGSKWFDDHHPFAMEDADSLVGSARRAGASRLVMTDKDWVKLKHYFGSTDLVGLVITVVKLSILFEGNDEELLLSQIASAL